MVTSRGLAVGDQLSTMEELYGAPQKMDTDVSSDKPKNTYFYISPNQDQVLIFYADGALGTIQGVLASENDKEAACFLTGEYGRKRSGGRFRISAPSGSFFSYKSACYAGRRTAFIILETPGSLAAASMVE